MSPRAAPEGSKVTKRLAGILAVLAATWLTFAFAAPTPVSSAAVDTADASIPVDPVTALEMHVTANCIAAAGQLPVQRRRPTCARRKDRSDFPATCGLARPPRCARWTAACIWNRTSTRPNTRLFKSLHRCRIDDDLLRRRSAREVSVPRQQLARRLGTGDPTDTGYIVCAHIQVVYAGVNLTSPDACAQTTFS